MLCHKGLLCFMMCTSQYFATPIAASRFCWGVQHRGIHFAMPRKHEKSEKTNYPPTKALLVRTGCICRGRFQTNNPLKPVSTLCFLGRLDCFPSPWNCFFRKSGYPAPTALAPPLSPASLFELTRPWGPPHFPKICPSSTWLMRTTIGGAGPC